MRFLSVVLMVMAPGTLRAVKRLLKELNRPLEENQDFEISKAELEILGAHPGLRKGLRIVKSEHDRLEATLKPKKVEKKAEKKTGGKTSSTGSEPTSPVVVAPTEDP